jgi:hypothetical protein
MKAIKDIFVDANDKIVDEPSTTGGTFKIAAEGGTLSDQDAARYGITAENAEQYGLTAESDPEGGVIEGGKAQPQSGLNIDESGERTEMTPVGVGVTNSVTSTGKATKGD